jgi:hypothetical protein
MDTDRSPDVPAQPPANAAHPDARPEELEADEAFAAKTVRSFIRDGRLASIPAREKRRLVIYRYLRDQVFTEDRGYEEREVNQRLALFHPDVATIRRGMVDARLVTREGGIYRRFPPSGPDVVGRPGDPGSI